MFATLTGLRSQKDNKNSLTAMVAEEFGTVLPEFHSIIVSDDIDVILKDADKPGISIGGDRFLSRFVSPTVSGGRLQITAGGISLANKVRVTISVTGLKHLTVDGSSEVYSAGVLRTPDLRLVMNGSCRISIRTKGIIRIDKHIRYEFVYSRNQQVKQIGDPYFN